MLASRKSPIRFLLFSWVTRPKLPVFALPNKQGGIFKSEIQAFFGSFALLRQNL